MHRLQGAEQMIGEEQVSIDHRELNKRSVKNKYPPPRIEDLFNQLREAIVG